MPTPEDRNFIRGIVNGQKKPTAFKESYPNHPTVKRYMDIVNKRVEPEDEGERSRLNASIAQMAKDKAQAKYIAERLVAFQESMDVLASKSIIVANDLLDNGRSEKVKADLAIEFIRHKVGTPVQKVQAQVEKTVHFSFGEPPEKIRGKDDLSDILEGEVIDEIT